MTNSFLSQTLSLNAVNQLNKTSGKLSKTFERLSSGLRINSASDDAAGLAVSEGLRADTLIMQQAVRNVNDGISSLQIVDGALSELESLLVRVRELATQAASGSLRGRA